MDYKEYGGALFLGVKKPVVKAHGSSDEKLFEYTLKQAEKFVENKAVDKMIEAFEKYGVFNSEMIDDLIRQLKSFNDANIRKEIEKDPDLMLKLVHQYFHCG